MGSGEASRWSRPWFLSHMAKISPKLLEKRNWILMPNSTCESFTNTNTALLFRCTQITGGLAEFQGRVMLCGPPSGKQMWWPGLGLKWCVHRKPKPQGSDFYKYINCTFKIIIIIIYSLAPSLGFFYSKFSNGSCTYLWGTLVFNATLNV